MSQNQIRVLHVLGTTNLGGAESRVMELYRAMDRENIQFDFLIHTTQEGSYSNNIRELGGNIYSVPRFKVYNYFQYKKAIREFFEKHSEFTAVHGHMTSTAAIYLPIAKKVYKKNGKNILTLSHARSAGVDKGFKGKLTKLIRRNLKNKADYCLTCSYEAGVAVYGEEWVKKGKVWTIPNAIDCDRFRYDELVRKEMRANLGVEDKFVIGHVGRFGFMKNHTYLVDIFEEMCKERNDIAMIFIGKGEEEENIRSKLVNDGLEKFGDEKFLIDKVQFLGNHFDVERYYQAFDYFVFPSIFEGLPGSVVEAQASGLHCLVSEKITKEVGLTSLVTYKSIDVEAKDWAQEILSHIEEAFNRSEKVGSTACDMIAYKGFDVRKQASQMEAFYRTGQNPPGQMTK